MHPASHSLSSHQSLLCPLGRPSHVPPTHPCGPLPLSPSCTPGRRGRHPPGHVPPARPPYGARPPPVRRCTAAVRWTCASARGRAAWWATTWDLLGHTPEVGCRTAWYGRWGSWVSAWLGIRFCVADAVRDAGNMRMRQVQANRIRRQGMARRSRHQGVGARVGTWRTCWGTRQRWVMVRYDTAAGVGACGQWAEELLRYTPEREGRL